MEYSNGDILESPKKPLLLKRRRKCKMTGNPHGTCVSWVVASPIRMDLFPGNFVVSVLSMCARYLLSSALNNKLFTFGLHVHCLADSIIVETINGIDEGNIALFQCLRRDNRKPANVRRWLFGGRKLPMAKTGRIFVKESATNHQLYIKDARTSDSGKYTCVAHIQGRMVNASNYLSVSCKNL